MGQAAPVGAVPDGAGPAASWSAGVTLATGVGGVRGVVAVSGGFDLEIVPIFGAAVDRLLDDDVAEIWVDLRDVVAPASVAVAALVRGRRRARRVGARYVLVLSRGDVPRLLRAAGQAESFEFSAHMPSDLFAAVAADGVDDRDPALWPDVPPDGLDTGGPERVPVLLEDPDLGLGIPDDLLAAARRELVAPARQLRRGPWDAGEESDAAGCALGVLLLEGLVIRRVGRGGRYGAELLGAGDVLRVGHHPGEEAAPGFATVLKVVVPGRVVVLDDEFARCAAQYPEVAANLLGRVMARSHALAVTMAVAHYPRVERRLLVVLWHIAQRWGRVTPEGVVLRLPLTHWILADLTAARRPSVTLAVRQLQRAGVLERRPGEWVLHGSPPPDLVVPPAPEELATGASRASWSPPAALHAP